MHECGTVYPDVHFPSDLNRPSLTTTPGMQIGLVVGLREPAAAAAAAQAMQNVPTVLFLDCGPEYRKQTRLGGLPVLSKDAFAQAVAKLVPWGKGELCKSS